MPFGFLHRRLSILQVCFFLASATWVAFFCGTFLAFMFSRSFCLHGVLVSTLAACSFRFLSRITWQCGNGDTDCITSPGSSSLLATLARSPKKKNKKPLSLNSVRNTSTPRSLPWPPFASTSLTVTFNVLLGSEIYDIIMVYKRAHCKSLALRIIHLFRYWWC